MVVHSLDDVLVERAVALFHPRYASAVYRAATMHCDTEAVMRHNMGPTTQELRDSKSCVIERDFASQTASIIHRAEASLADPAPF